jgi:hypothetical protein
MKIRGLVFVLIFVHLTLPAYAKKLNWQHIEAISPGTHIYVTALSGTPCLFKKATDSQLFCTFEDHDPNGLVSFADRAFNRAEIRDVCVGDIETCTAYDYSKGPLSLLAAFEAGGGWDYLRRQNSFAGVKAGIGGVSMDLQYDRIDAHSGFSVEGSGVIPLFRVPRYQPKNDRLFFRAYGEPGLGYRAGDGPFGQYACAKVLVLLGDKWVNGDHGSPYIEFQRRFPFNSPLSGDNRTALGYMWALCEHCGVN